MSRKNRKPENGPGRPRDPKADEKILRAAIELFSEHGEEGTGMHEIAKRAGVAATTLYRRWSSKEELLVDAFALVRREEEPSGSYEAVSYEMLLRVMTEVVPSATRRLDLGKLVARLIGSVRSNPKLMEAYWKAHLLPRRVAFNRSLEQMRDNGNLPAHTDPEIVQDMLVGALLYRFLVQPGKHSIEERLDYSRRLLRQIGFQAATGARAAKPRRPSAKGRSRQRAAR
jgi:AcrR family transcriptional regulator